MEYLKYTAKNLPRIMITGKVYVPENNCHFTRRPSEFIMYFISKGSMIIQEDNNIYKLKKGDLIFLDPSHTHKGKPVASEVEYYFVHFPCKNDLYKTTAALRLIELFTNICAESFNSETVNPGTNHLIMDLLNYIHKNANHNLSSTEVEAQFHMNFDYLNRIFKAITKTTIITYSNKYRISESKKLLKSGLYSVKQIAEIMGFSNEFYFSRVYKKYEGVAPSDLN